MPPLRVKLHYPKMGPPTKAHATDAGFDLTCMDIIDKGNNLLLLDTGVSLEPPPGFYTELFVRSSMIKTNFILANSVGIIDPDYRGIVYLPLRYIGKGNGQQEAQNLLGTRVAQLIVKKIEPITLEICEQLSLTPRGSRGFGSSGA